MIKQLTCIVIFILFFAAVSTQAKVSITYSSGDKEYFSIFIPDGWSINVGSNGDLTQNPGAPTKSPRLISAMPNSDLPLWFGMWVPEDLENIKGVKEYMASLGLDLLANAVITEQRDDKLNSMDVKYINGTGDKDGEFMDFRAGFFQLSPEHVAIAIYIGPPETTVTHGKDLTRMIQSLQPLVK